MYIYICIYESRTRVYPCTCLCMSVFNVCMICIQCMCSLYPTNVSTYICPVSLYVSYAYVLVGLYFLCAWISFYIVVCVCVDVNVYMGLDFPAFLPIYLVILYTDSSTYIYVCGKERTSGVGVSEFIDGHRNQPVGA